MAFFVAGGISAVVAFVAMLVGATSCTKPSRFGWTDSQRVMFIMLIWCLICAILSSVIGGPVSALGSITGTAVVWMIAFARS